MIDMHTCVTHRAHFRGNGSCDAMREANKREDCEMPSEKPMTKPMSRTGMESEIAPYTGAETGMTPYAAPQSTPYASAATGYDNPAYGVDHRWTEAEEEGLNTIPQDSFTEPMNADEAARNSWRALLARNVGRNVLVRFLMGTQNLITVEGELYEVGTDYIVIYQPLWDSHITADLYSVKFVEFREPPGVMTLN